MFRLTRRRWHVLTAIAVYIYFALVEQLTASGNLELSINTSGTYAWPVSDHLKHLKGT